MVKLYGNTAKVIHHNAGTYTAHNGVLEVPEHLVELAMQHGFTRRAPDLDEVVESVTEEGAGQGLPPVPPEPPLDPLAKIPLATDLKKDEKPEELTGNQADTPTVSEEEQRARMTALLGESAQVDTQVDPEKQEEYEYLIAGGLSDAEARATVWPEA